MTTLTDLINSTSGISVTRKMDDDVAKLLTFDSFKQRLKELDREKEDEEPKEEEKIDIAITTSKDDLGRTVTKYAYCGLSGYHYLDKQGFVIYKSEPGVNSGQCEVCGDIRNMVIAKCYKDHKVCPGCVYKFNADYDKVIEEDDKNRRAFNDVVMSEVRKLQKARYDAIMTPQPKSTEKK